MLRFPFRGSLPVTALLGLALAGMLLSARSGSAADGAELKFHQIKVNKILFLGNSITLHGPKPDIGWEANWGMAASSQDKDYVHRVLQAITTATGREPQSMVSNVADFERQYDRFDAPTQLKQQLDFRADLVIVAIGENVPALTTEEAKSKYRTSLTKLLQAFQEASHPVLLTRSSFWHEPTRDTILREACREVGGIYVDVSTLDQDEKNFARSERDYSHAGVAAHPGDRGMQALADAILQGLSQQRP